MGGDREPERGDRAGDRQLAGGDVDLAGGDRGGDRDELPPPPSAPRRASAEAAGLSTPVPLTGAHLVRVRVRP